MKGKKLPKKNSGMFQDEDALGKPGVKLGKQKRSRKPSIYDEMDEMDDLDYQNRNEVDDYYEEDIVEDEKDYY